MKPEDKAKELVDKMDKEIGTYSNSMTKFLAKKCAIIAVDELINMCKLFHIHNVNVNTKIYSELPIEYWKEVKSKIEKL